MRAFLMVAWAGAMVAVLFFGIGAVELSILTVLWIAWFVLLFKWAIPGDRRDKARTD